MRRSASCARAPLGQVALRALGLTAMCRYWIELLAESAHGREVPPEVSRRYRQLDSRWIVNHV